MMMMMMITGHFSVFLILMRFVSNAHLNELYFFFSVPGGPGAAHEVEQFVWNDHVVVPVRCTGGAAGGKFNVPEKIFEVCLHMFVK